MPGEDKQITNQNQFQVGNTSNLFNTAQNQNTTQQQSGASNPWSPTKPLLDSILAKYSGQNTDVTPEQRAALGTLQAGASAAPNFGGAAAGAVNNLFGSNTAPQVGMLSKSLADYHKNIGGTASGAELDPYQTPGFSDALTTMQNDITNKVKSVYAGSGRDPSGAGSFAKTLGRGLTEGIAPVIASQFNQNKGNQLSAAGSLYSAGGGTAGQITSQQQIPLANAAQGVGLLPQVSSAFTSPGASQLTAANLAQSLPFGNLQQLLAPLMGIAGLGTETTGTSTGTGATTGSGGSSGSSQSLGVGQGTTTQPQNTLSNILGGVSGGIGLLSLLSDKRAKTDIAPVGMLNDGQRIFKFRYRGAGPKVHIGLMAQDVEKTMPEAVSEIGGLKLVDYNKATRRAEQMEAA